MIWRLRILGIEIASLECDGDQELEPEGITGGAMHNFERDGNPYSPDERYNWEPEDFGFR